MFLQRTDAGPVLLLLISWNLQLLIRSWASCTFCWTFLLCSTFLVLLSLLRCTSFGPLYLSTRGRLLLFGFNSSKFEVTHISWVHSCSQKLPSCQLTLCTSREEIKDGESEIWMQQKGSLVFLSSCQLNSLVRRRYWMAYRGSGITKSKVNLKLTLFLYIYPAKVFLLLLLLHWITVQQKYQKHELLFLSTTAAIQPLPVAPSPCCCVVYERQSMAGSVVLLLHNHFFFLFLLLLLCWLLLCGGIVCISPEE